MIDEELIDCHKCGYTHREGYNCAAVSASDSNDLLSAAGSACIDFYMQMHVSGMREQIEPLKKLWSIGHELYLAKRNGRRRRVPVDGPHERKVRHGITKR